MNKKIIAGYLTIIVFAIFMIGVIVGQAAAVQQVYVFYETASPFPGYIRFAGRVDMAQVADGSTLRERLETLKIEYPGSAIRFFPNGPPPDPEAVKYDIATDSLVLLDPGDITPAAQKELNETAKAQAIIGNLPSWSQVQTNINNISSMDDAKAFLLKLVRIVYWDIKNRPD